MTKKRKELGRYGEQLALKQYLLRGYALLYQNYRCRFGEIDLVLKKQQKLLFIEVKTRTSSAYGPAEEAISPRKQHKIRTVSLYFLKNYPQYAHYEIQFDVVSIFIDTREKKAWFKRTKRAF